MSGDKKGLSYDVITELLNKRDAEEGKNRRRKADWVSKMATILSFCAWCIMLVVWVLYETASPETGMTFTQTFFLEHFGTDATEVMRTRWNNTLLYAAFFLMLVSMGTCVFAFLMNKMRMKRKTDKYKISIFVIGGITVIAFVAFVVRFWSMLF